MFLLFVSQIVTCPTQPRTFVKFRSVVSQNSNFLWDLIDAKPTWTIVLVKTYLLLKMVLFAKAEHEFRLLQLRW